MPEDKNEFEQNKDDLYLQCLERNIKILTYCGKETDAYLKNTSGKSKFNEGENISKPKEKLSLKRSEISTQRLWLHMSLVATTEQTALRAAGTAARDKSGFQTDSAGSRLLAWVVCVPGLILPFIICAQENLFSLPNPIKRIGLRHLMKKSLWNGRF